MKTEKQKYCSYRRVSSKRQAESGLGVDFQTTVIQHYVNKANGELVKDFVEYGSGGSYINRRELMAAIDYCIKNDCFLVVSRTDRLSRNVENTIDIWRRLDGKLFICDLPIRGDGKLDKSALYLHADHAERELEIISMRNLAMHSQRRSRGEKHVTKYKLSSQDRKIGSDSQKYARQLFYEDNKLVYFVDGLIREERTIEEVAYELNENDFRTFTGKKYTWSTARKLIMMLAEKKVRKMKEKKGEVITGKVYIPEILKPRRKGFVGHQTLKVNG